MRVRSLELLNMSRSFSHPLKSLGSDIVKCIVFETQNYLLSEACEFALARALCLDHNFSCIIN